MSEAVPLLILSHHGAPSARFRDLEAAKALTIRDECSLDLAEIAAADGVILTMHLDQIWAAERRAAFDAVLARGGRIFFNGHVAREFVSGLRPFVLSGRHFDDLTLTVIADHPVFAGIDRELFQARRGVRGFYGRGHDPMLPGGRALTGVGRDAAPLDWVAETAAGGAFFCHAGNDVWGNTDDEATNARLIDNVVAWAAGRIAA